VLGKAHQHINDLQPLPIHCDGDPVGCSEIFLWRGAGQEGNVGAPGLFGLGAGAIGARASETPVPRPLLTGPSWSARAIRPDDQQCLFRFRTVPCCSTNGRSGHPRIVT